MNTATSTRADRLRTRDTTDFTYRTTVGDDLLQNTVLTPETVKVIQDNLAKYSGDLAYTPAIEEKILNVLQRRYESDLGDDVFRPTHYGVYEEPEMAAFYGVDTTMTDNMQTRKETFAETRNRLIEETQREVEIELGAWAQQMNLFRKEDWARHGVYDETLYIHTDPDVTLLRNEGRGWNTLDRPVSTSDHTNIIDMYEGQPEYTFPTPHPAWTVDRKDNFWYRLQKTNNYISQPYHHEYEPPQ